MSSVKVTRCYSITPLLNVILIIVVHYGIFAPLFIVRLRKIAELVYMVSENMCPTYLNNLFTKNLCNRTLRSAHNKQLPTFNTVKYGKRSIKYNGPQLWNSLPD